MKYLMEEGEGSNCPGNVRQIWCGGLISDGSFQFHPTAVCWCCVLCVETGMGHTKEEVGQQWQARGHYG